MMTPDDIDVWVGLDVGKSAHHAHALDHDGNTLYERVSNCLCMGSSD